MRQDSYGSSKCIEPEKVKVYGCWICLYPDPSPHPDPNPGPEWSLSPNIHSIPASCSVTAKCPCSVTILLIFHPWLKCPSLLIHNGTFPQAVMRQLHSAFWLYAPWQLVATHLRRLITPHHFPFIPYAFSITHSCFNIPDPHHRCLVNPRSRDLSISDYYSSVDSLV